MKKMLALAVVGGMFAVGAIGCGPTASTAPVVTPKDKATVTDKADVKDKATVTDKADVKDKSTVTDKATVAPKDK
jgi:hypothetical protein